MKDKKKIGIIVGIVAVIIAVIIGIIASGGEGDDTKLQKLLDTGAKYLAELDYEQAVAVYREAIALEPKSVDAYLGLAEAYLGMGDFDAARKALEDGYAATGDEIFQDWITTIWETEPEDIEEERPEVDAFGRKQVYFDMDMYYEDVAKACTVDGIPLVSYDYETLRADYVSRFPDTFSNEDGSYIIHSNKELSVHDAGYISRNEDGAETIMMNDGDTGTKLQVSLSQGGYAVFMGEVDFESQTGIVNRVSSWLGASLEEFLEYYLPGSYASYSATKEGLIFQLNQGFLTFDFFEEGLRGEEGYYLGHMDLSLPINADSSEADWCSCSISFNQEEKIEQIFFFNLLQ